MALLGTWGIARLAYHGRPALYGPEITVWSDVLEKSGTRVDANQVEVAFVAARMVDGRIIEGFLRSFPSGPSSPVDDMGLQAPIYVRHDPKSPRKKIGQTQFMILRLAQVVDVSVRFEKVRLASQALS